MSRKRRRKARRREPGQSPAAGPTLDLHGHTAAEARREATRWLTARAREGIPVATVVTGRGLHSQAGAVLPSEIRHLLSELQAAGVVEDFTPVSLGGAFRVHLERPPPIRPRARPADTGSAALRLRAEENLIELGVEPTPEIVAAEVRRILREKEAGGDPNR